MGVYLHWEIEDDEGTNPTNTPGWFDFCVECEVEPGDPGYLYNANGDGCPPSPPTAEVVGVTCRRVHLDGETELRKPTEDEANSLSMWFYGWVDTHPQEMEQIREQAFEYAWPEPDYDDLDD